jgi:hypothetical protein
MFDGSERDGRVERAGSSSPEPVSPSTSVLALSLSRGTKTRINIWEDRFMEETINP